MLHIIFIEGNGTEKKAPAELGQTILEVARANDVNIEGACGCLLYTSPSPRDYAASRMPSSA